MTVALTPLGTSWGIVPTFLDCPTVRGPIAGQAVGKSGLEALIVLFPPKADLVGAYDEVHPRLPAGAELVVAGLADVFDGYVGAGRAAEMVVRWIRALPRPTKVFVNLSGGTTVHTWTVLRIVETLRQDGLHTVHVVATNCKEDGNGVKYDHHLNWVESHVPKEEVSDVQTS